MEDFIKENYNFWRESVKEKDLLEELDSLTDEKEIEDRFYRELEFGTGGLRGTLGAGTNRMNVHTVARATFGFAEYLLKNKKSPSVVIAYDSRIMSKEFARLAAEILSFKGIKAYIFKELMPTPVLSFSVRYLKADGGIVITASHNPKEYNGYKVYNENGCQITDEAAAEIYSEIKRADYFGEFLANNELIAPLSDEVLDKFIEEISGYKINEVVSQPKIVYTPLNGTGRKPVLKILDKIGIKDVTVVKEQENPDGYFPTCPFPNPEYPETFNYAFKYAKEKDADIVLATDPDADRVGVAVKDDGGEYKILSGNEVGILLLEYLLSEKSVKGMLGKEPTAIKTIVTTDMAFKVAEKYGVKIKEVLTGFKYIGEEMDKTKNYVFGFEESCGYLVGKHARDKDAVSAVMSIAEMTARYKAQGMTLYEKLQSLYKEYGFYSTALITKTFSGISGAKRMKDILSSIRENPWKEIEGIKIDDYTDYINGYDGLPKSNVQRFKGDGLRFIIRNSGTEPKIKVYIEMTADTKAEADKRVEVLKGYAERCMD
ncbi:MAG: phospho-sugar mutase [Clostridia bacterium]|nr:phospho-sugar mutase [Clostridia bacterium]